MKKGISILIALTLTLLHTPMYGNDKALSQHEYEANEGCESTAALGHGSSSAAHSTVSMSMVGWGLGLAIAIAIIAGVIHQSASSHSSSDTPNQ